MKAVILAGGLGTRLAEETSDRPKPMVEIGGRPILWHIMKTYSHYGINEFIICCGYKGYMIKEYFANYALHMSDVTFDLRTNKTVVHKGRAEPWKITLVDTGDNSLTGGRLLRVKDYVKNDDAFCFTYGDGLCDLDISETIKFHHSHEKLATVTATYPSARFGALSLNGNTVEGFEEKPEGDGGMINGGYFVLSPKVLDLIEGDHTTWEKEPLSQLTEQRQLMAFKHTGFWHPMDTLRDKQKLQSLWDNGIAPWRKW
jgi:glucose-1-phosphate cytidylyltransferase